ncbi:MAG: signal peptide peptidase SppA, partial [Candidatus Heimdallarchaeota archaeon]|nr:signal peptide peptidase SppA [Candidatus Heimdallarchaeota archaeon]
VDSLLYEVDVRKELKQLCGIMENKGLRFVPIKKYMRTEGKTGVYSSNRIAVIYALGEIHFGKGDETSIGRENIVNAIRKAASNKNVNAIVMRVNSGGGVALTSDIIWKEVHLAKEKKPFIVSFGRVAASGGYYIACAADTIVAEPNTLTGSIGAYAVVPNMNKFFDNKLGITFDRVRTGKYSDLITTTRELTRDEKAILTNHVDRTYDTFVNRVADGRKMTFDEVHKIGQGRIWSGTEAKEIGLVDVIGGLDVAVDIAAEKAGIDNYRIIEYPKIRETFEQILEILYEDVSASIFQKEIGVGYKYYSQIINMLNANEVQTRIPFDVEIY